jgi:hypothetical protein
MEATEVVVEVEVAEANTNTKKKVEKLNHNRSSKELVKICISNIRFTNALLPLPMCLPKKDKELCCIRYQMEVFQQVRQSILTAKSLPLSHTIPNKLESSSISH